MRLVTGLLIALTTAWAGNDVSFVASTGSDGNDCTRTTPCRTFQSASLATNLNGTVQALDTADYGPLVVLSAMTIDGAGTGAVIQGTVGQPTGVGINIQGNVGPANVTLRNLVIRPGLTPSTSTIAISVIANDAPAVLNLENVRIEMGDGQNSIGVYSSPTFLSRINLRNVSITGGLIGIELLGAAGAPPPTFAAERVSITNAGTGILAQDYAISVRESVFTGNGSGITVTSNVVPTTALIERCEMSFNSTGLQAFGTNFSATVRLGDSVITSNATGVSTSGAGSIISFRTNMLAGNVTDGALALTTSLK